MRKEAPPQHNEENPRVGGSNSDQNVSSGLRLQFKEFKEKRQELRRLWSPIGTILAIISALGSVHTYYQQLGYAIVTPAALLTFSVAILFTIPRHAIKLFALRSVAFCLDLLTLFIATFLIGEALFETGHIQPTALMSMVILWSWFLYFVIFEGLSGATVGKLITRIRVRSISPSGKLSLGRAFILNSLTLLLPLLVASWITIKESKWGAFLTESSLVAGLLIIPVSIAFLNQRSVVDWLVGTVVEERHRSQIQSFVGSGIRPRNWLTLPCFCLVFGCLLYFATLPILADVATGKKKLPEQTESELSRYAVMKANDPLTSELWTVIPAGFRQVDDVISSIDVATITPNDFELSDNFVTIPTAESALESQKEMAIINVSLSQSYVGIIEKTRMVDNVCELMREQVRAGKIPIPFFIAMRFSFTHTLGPFVVIQEEDTLIGAVKTGQGTGVIYGDPALPSGTTFHSSAYPLGGLLLGDLSTYSDFYNTAIW